VRLRRQWVWLSLAVAHLVIVKDIMGFMKDDLCSSLFFVWYATNIMGFVKEH